MSEPLLAYQFQSLAGLPLVHGLSGRVPSRLFEGDVGHGRGTVAEAIEQNRTAFLDELGLAADTLTVGRQTHGANVRVVDAGESGLGRYPAFDGFPDTDALATDEPGVTLGVIVADCVPILIYDPEHHVVAVVHAGWRGTVAGIAGNAVSTLRTRFRSDPRRLIAGIGPSIGPCCYQVGEEVISRWNDRTISVMPEDDTSVRCVESAYHFDLWEANRQVLRAAGMNNDRIETSGVCVRCRGERFFSYRAAGQGLASPGRMLMVAQLQPRS